MPIAIKDVISTRGVRTTCGSKILETYVPPYDATAVERLEKAGAVVLGKTNCDEFAMGSSNENSAYGPVRNPVGARPRSRRIQRRLSGGRGGWSCRGCSWHRHGGSIRQPGSFCGVSGLMPTYGRVSRYGLVAFASSLDKIGPFTTNIADAAAVMSVIAGHDPNDSTSANVPVRELLRKQIEQPRQGIAHRRPGRLFRRGAGSGSEGEGPSGHRAA